MALLIRGVPFVQDYLGGLTMCQLSSVLRWAVAGVVYLAVVQPVDAELQRYDIEPGGEYVYFPSAEGPGIPGCDPNAFQCTFGIDGSFSILTDAGEQTARLTDLDLTLIGNEDVQNSSAIVLVTVNGVTAWLENRLFRDVGALGPFTIYADETYPELQLTDFLNGTVTLTGGFDSAPIDGDGARFNLTANLVPEPSCFILLAAGLACALTAVRIRTTGYTTCR